MTPGPPSPGPGSWNPKPTDARPGESGRGRRRRPLCLRKEPTTPLGRPTPTVSHQSTSKAGTGLDTGRLDRLRHTPTTNVRSLRPFARGKSPNPLHPPPTDQDPMCLGSVRSVQGPKVRQEVEEGPDTQSTRTEPV